MKPKNKAVRSFRIDPAVEKKLNATAKKQKVPKTSLIQKYIDEGINRENKK